MQTPDNQSLPATSQQLADTAKQHIDALQNAQSALSRNQPHQKSAEGKIFDVVLQAISFVLHLLHAGHTADQQSAKQPEQNTSPANADDANA